jgi:hypothetical protein
VPVLTGEVPPSSRPRRPLRLSGPRRRLIALAAAGVTGAVLVTGAVTGASAAAPASAPSHVITLTSSTSSAAGHLIVRLRYQLGSAGKFRPLSVSYAGGTSQNLRHPALIFSLRPLLPFPLRLVRKGNFKAQGPFVTLILRVRDSRHFSGTVPSRLFGKVSIRAGRKVPVLGGLVLETTLASVSSAKHKQIAINAPIGLQVGILLGPAIP